MNASDFETTEEDLDKFLDKIKNEYKDGWSEENWEKVGRILKLVQKERII